MDSQIYSVPLAHRRTENLHIVFWLIKDLSWCLSWRSFGVFMILPTLGAAIYISWRARQMRSELAHNLAVVFWISANAWWMLAEFYGFDEQALWLGIDGRHWSLLPFLIGLAILLRHYLGEFMRLRRQKSLPQP